MSVDVRVPNIDETEKTGHVATGHPGGGVVEAVGAVIWVGGIVAVNCHRVSLEINVREHGDGVGQEGFDGRRDLDFPGDRPSNNRQRSITKRTDRGAVRGIGACRRR